MAKDSCGTCRFSALNKGEIGSLLCHRHSPAAVPIQNAHGVMSLAIYPPTRPDDYCGDYAAAPAVEH